MSAFLRFDLLSENCSLKLNIAWGDIVWKRAYADWVKLAGYRQHLLACQIEMIELACASKGKNSADIRLVVDAMELLFTKPHITTFVILSADSDFLPLLNRLREQNKRTTESTWRILRTMS